MIPVAVGIAATVMNVTGSVGLTSNKNLPRTRVSIYRVYLKPALKAAGITAPVGWHTFRHSFGTLMKANGEDIKTIQELLRHANFKVTMDVYTQAVTDVKRTARSRVVRQIMGEKKEDEDEA
jgi:site-specific recombinase XerD